MPYASAIKLLSIYTVGSLVCVFVTAAFVKEVFSSAVAMIIYTCLSMVSLLLVCLFPTPVMVTGFAFVIGFAAAGGYCSWGNHHGNELSEWQRQGNGDLLHRRQHRELHDPAYHRKAFAD